MSCSILRHSLRFTGRVCATKTLSDSTKISRHTLLTIDINWKNFLIKLWKKVTILMKGKVLSIPENKNMVLFFNIISFSVAFHKKVKQPFTIISYILPRSLNILFKPLINQFWWNFNETEVQNYTIWGQALLCVYGIRVSLTGMFRQPIS